MKKCFLFLLLVFLLLVVPSPTFAYTSYPLVVNSNGVYWISTGWREDIVAVKNGNWVYTCLLTGAQTRCDAIQVSTASTVDGVLRWATTDDRAASWTSVRIHPFPIASAYTTVEIGENLQKTVFVGVASLFAYAIVLWAGRLMKGVKL